MKKIDVYLDVNVVVDVLCGRSTTPGLRDLNRSLANSLHHPEGGKYRIHLSAHVLWNVVNVLVREFGKTKAEAVTAVLALTAAATQRGGKYDDAHEFMTHKELLISEAKRQDHYDSKNKLEVEDEAVLRSIVRIEAILGRQVTFISGDTDCRNTWTRRGGKSISIKETASFPK